MLSGDATPQRIEHAKCRVENHAKNHHGHGLAQPWVQTINDGEHWHGIGGDGTNSMEQRDGGNQQHRGVNQAASKPTGSSGAGIEQATANNNRHGNRNHQVKTDIVHCGDNPVRQSGRDFRNGSCLLRGRGGIGERQRINTGQQDKADDKRRDGTDHCGHSVNIEETGCNGHQHHDYGTDPHGDAPLLLHVGTGTGEHDEPCGEERDNHANVQYSREDGVRYASENFAVLAGLKVASQLQNDHRHQAHDYR